MAHDPCVFVVYACVHVWLGLCVAECVDAHAVNNHADTVMPGSGQNHDGAI